MRIWWQQVWALLGLLVLGCGIRDEEAKSRLVMGLLVPHETLRVVADRQTAAGATLAAEEIEARGGVEIQGERIPLELLVEDTEGRPEVAISKALALLRSEEVTALLGLPNSEGAIAVGKVAEAHGVLMVSTLSTHPETTRDKRFVFRMIYTDTLQSQVMAEFAYGDLGARRAALLVDGGNSYSQHLANGFRSAFQTMGGEIVAWEVFTAEEIDAPEQLERIRAVAPDVLVLPTNPVFRDHQMHLVRSAGVTAPFLGGDSWSFVPFPPSSERGSTFFTGPWAQEPVTAPAKDFSKRFWQRFNKAPTGSAALAYDAVNLLVEVAEEADSVEPEAIREALSKTSFDGVSGRLDFEGTGDPQRSVLILQVDASGTNRMLREVHP